VYKRQGVLVIGIAIAIIIPFSLLSGLKQSPNPLTGHDQPKLVDPIANQDIIRQTLANAGDTSAAAAIIDSSADKMKQDNLGLRDVYASKTDETSKAIVSKIDLLNTSIDTLKASKTPANATAFLTRLSDLDDAIENTFESFHPNDAGYPTKMPVPSANLTFNAELHGGSKLRPDHVDNNGVYTAYDQGVCDAVDLSASQTDPVYPIFQGVVADVSSDGADGQKVVIQNGDYRMLYAHLTNVNIKVGDTVNLTTSLGNPKINHIQIEAIYRDQCLTTTYSDLIDHNKKTPKHDQFGGYLWDRIVEKFHITV
jgi:murein DD-endopeptidase MepM/ murein hydrolase activator NlpD